MQWPDMVNGGFELVCGMVSTANVIKLRKDRMVRGIDWRVTFLFTMFGVWNFYYYPHLNQWWSFAGGVVMALMNAVWLVLAYTYWRQYKRMMDIIVEEMKMPMKVS